MLIKIHNGNLLKCLNQFKKKNFYFHLFIYINALHIEHYLFTHGHMPPIVGAIIVNANCLYEWL